MKDPRVFRDGADVVVMSLDHYQSIMETMHLLASPANAAHLAKSVAQHQSGQAVRRRLVKCAGDATDADRTDC